MAELPINIELSRLIALGHAFGLVYEAVIIVACLSRKEYFWNFLQRSFSCLEIKLENIDLFISHLSCLFFSK